MNITLQDIAEYRQKIDELEVLIKTRDILAGRISTTANCIDALMSAVAKLNLPKPVAVVPIEPTVQPAQEEEVADSKEDRLLDVVARHQQGATLEDFITELGLSHHTVKRYLYSRDLGHKIFDRDVNERGETVWFAKE